MPKRVDHRARREQIARAVGRVIDERGWAAATLREVAREADVSLGQLQHYFSSRTEMLTFAMEFAAEQTAERIENALAERERPPHPRDVLRVVLAEMLPLHADARAFSRMNAAYVLETLHDSALRNQARLGMQDGRAMVERLIRQAMDDGQLAPDLDPAIETDLVLALTGLSPLLDLGVITPEAALAAIDQYLDRVFSRPR